MDSNIYYAYQPYSNTLIWIVIAVLILLVLFIGYMSNIFTSDIKHEYALVTVDNLDKQQRFNLIVPLENIKTKIDNHLYTFYNDFIEKKDQLTGWISRISYDVEESNFVQSLRNRQFPDVLQEAFRDLDINRLPKLHIFTDSKTL